MQGMGSKMQSGMIAVRDSNKSSMHTGDLVGQYLGRYRVDALLGEGNMGAVYQAFDENLARKVVLKIMHRQLASHDSFQQRFVQEAQAAARLDHPSIVKLYSFDTDPSLYMVMEYVEGPSLGQYLKHQQEQNEVVSLDTVLRLIAQIADALDYAHERGVIHRDIKPSNVLLKPLNKPDRIGDPKMRVIVTDFGLAKLLEGGMHTLTGTFMGTLSYMSPEQCLGRDLDGRSDIYSLGIVLYQVTTGHLPFNVKSPTDAIRMHVKEIPPSPRSVRPNLPEQIEKIIMQAIAKNPSSRFQTGGQFAAALRRAAIAIAPPIEGLSPQASIIINGDGSIIREPGTQIGLDQLLIYHAGGAPRVMGMVSDKMVAGRGQENEITLPDKGVSRHHARIERSGQDGWQVVDLSSTNGCFINSIRLQPETPEKWLPNTELRIGPYSLRWQQSMPVVTAMIEDQSSYIVDIEDRPSQTSPGEIEVVVDPASSAIAAGDSVSLQVMLVNRGPIVEHVNVRVEKLASEWITYSQELIKLMPGSRGFIRVTIQPPHGSSSRSGTHSFQIVATPMSNPEAFVAAACQLNIQAFSDFELYMSPKPLTNAGSIEVRVTNNGNAEATYVVTGVVDERDNLYDFEPENVKVRVRPGETQSGVLDIQATKRPLFGQPRRIPYELEVWSAGAGTKRVRSELEVRPKVPLWVMMVLLTTLIATIIFMVMWILLNQPPA